MTHVRWLQLQTLELQLLLSILTQRYAVLSLINFPKANPLRGEWTWTSGDRSSHPRLIAHRGASGMYPEHTMLAYRAAIEQGADYIECDICLTRVIELALQIAASNNSDHNYLGRISNWFARTNPASTTPPTSRTTRNLAAA